LEEEAARRVSSFAPLPTAPPPFVPSFATSSMASGGDLLRQLRSRQLVRPPPAPAGSAPAGSPSGTSVQICVCSASLCCGRGADAAAVELEELIAERELIAESARISLVRVGCSHQCDRAPVAQILIADVGATSARNGSIECVDSPAQCAKVVDAASLRALGAQQPRSARSGVDGLMHRRAAGMRWEALRDLGRARDDRSRRIGLSRLEEAIAGEMRAAASDAAQLARATRRAARLRERFAIAPPSPATDPPPAGDRPALGALDEGVTLAQRTLGLLTPGED
jgi:hypothetical protein